MVVKTSGMVLEHVEVANGIKYLKLEAPDIARSARPGQFVQVRCAAGCSPLLRKPFSIHEIDRANGTIGLLYEIKGHGTQMLSGSRAGESMEITGPSGNGFTLPGDPGEECNALLVGGGLGIAPLLPLAAELREKGHKTTVILGFNDASRLCRTEAFAREADRLIVTTVDGSSGEKGLVTDPMSGLMKREKINVIYACGPEPMLAAVARIAEVQRVKCEVSLEAYMACGVGACLGCVCRTKSIGGKPYARVCTEGPVFDSREVIWNG